MATPLLQAIVAVWRALVKTWGAVRTFKKDWAYLQCESEAMSYMSSRLTVMVVRVVHTVQAFYKPFLIAAVLAAVRGFPGIAVLIVVLVIMSAALCVDLIDVPVMPNVEAVKHELHGLLFGQHHIRYKLETYVDAVEMHDRQRSIMEDSPTKISLPEWWRFIRSYVATLWGLLKTDLQRQFWLDSARKVVQASYRGTVESELDTQWKFLMLLIKDVQENSVCPADAFVEMIFESEDVARVVLTLQKVDTALSWASRYWLYKKLVDPPPESRLRNLRAWERILRQDAVYALPGGGNPSGSSV